MRSVCGNSEPGWPEVRVGCAPRGHLPPQSCKVWVSGNSGLRYQCWHTGPRGGAQQNPGSPQLQGLLGKRLCSPLGPPTRPPESPQASSTVDIQVPSHMQDNKYPDHIQVSKPMNLRSLVFKPFFSASVTLLQMKPYQEGK